VSEQIVPGGAIWNIPERSGLAGVFLIVSDVIHRGSDASRVVKNRLSEDWSASELYSMTKVLSDGKNASHRSNCSGVSAEIF
jgi:hypothetical protein